ncbi:MAG: hypothetical protein K0R47_341 [Brevibacillus sp.]|nr:hypothetical protein [Brevibacillus sp.]
MAILFLCFLKFYSNRLSTYLWWWGEAGFRSRSAWKPASPASCYGFLRPGITRFKGSKAYQEKNEVIFLKETPGRLPRKGTWIG